MIKVYQMPSEAIKATEAFPFMYGKEGLFDLEANIEHYVHVCNVATDDLDKAFEIGNIGPEGDINRKRPMRSFSVGDIFVKENGDTFVVAGFGFDQIEPQFMLSVEEVA